MNPTRLVSPLRRLPWLATVALFSALTALRAPAIDVSGVYENAGTTAADSGRPAEAVSFHGLLALEFDLELARTLYSQATRVAVTQTASIFRIVCTDPDGAVTWSGQWNHRQGYTVDDQQVNLLFRSKRYEHDGFTFTLSTAAGGNLLVVDVRRINSTWFGPVEKPIGVFLFSRLPGQTPGSAG